MPDTVTVITVAYNSHEVLGDMLSSVPEDTPVIIVDNGSQTPVEREMFKRHNAQVIHSGANLGFGAACNLGARHAESEYLLFLNPDSHLTDGCIQSLLKAYSKHPEASAFNPVIKNEAGRMFFRKGNILRPDFKRLNTPPVDDREIPVLSGSAIFIKNTIFQTVGGFDENIFLYHEDDDLSARLAKQIGPLFHFADAEVLHLGGKSSADTKQLSSFKAYHLARSRVFVGIKYGQFLPRSRTIMKGVVRLFKPSNFTKKGQWPARWGYIRGAASTLFDAGRNTARNTIQGGKK